MRGAGSGPYGIISTWFDSAAVWLGQSERIVCAFANLQIGSKTGSDGAALLHQQASLSHRGSAAGRHDGPGFDPPVHPDMWQGAAPAQRTTRWFAGRWLVGGRSGPVWAAGRGRLDCGAGEGRTLAATGDDRCVFVGRLGASTHGEAVVTCACDQLTAAAGWVWCVYRCDPGRGGGHLAGLMASQSRRIGCRAAPMRRFGWSATLDDRPGQRRGAGDDRSALVRLPLFAPTRCALRALSCVPAAAASLGWFFLLRGLSWLSWVTLWVH